jgi:hypothetical protein
VISRFLAVLLVGFALLVAASAIHIISIAYLIGVLSGLLLGMMMWFRFSR